MKWGYSLQDEIRHALFRETQVILAWADDNSSVKAAQKQISNLLAERGVYFLPVSITCLQSPHLDLCRSVIAAIGWDNITQAVKELIATYGDEGALRLLQERSDETIGRAFFLLCQPNSNLAQKYLLHFCSRLELAKLGLCRDIESVTDRALVLKTCLELLTRAYLPTASKTQVVLWINANVLIDAHPVSCQPATAFMYWMAINIPFYLVIVISLAHPRIRVYDYACTIGNDLLGIATFSNIPPLSLSL